VPRKREQRSTALAELRDMARAMTGGFLFGIPLLYTMEIWETGRRASAAHIAALFAITYVLVLLIDRSTGFRSHESRAWRASLGDSAEALAIALVGTTVVLAAIGQIATDDPPHAVLGAVVFAAAPFALGIAIANHFLDGGGKDDDAGNAKPTGDPTRAMVADLGAAAVGALFLAFNIAPTDEVILLAATAGPVRLAAIAAISIVASYAIVFAAGYTGQAARRSQHGVVQGPWAETVASYAVALVAAAAMLALYGRFDLASTYGTIAEVIVLALPAAIGGAAGRIAI
jgi:putative integral membrane protein (TIGR02587 family)